MQKVILPTYFASILVLSFCSTTLRAQSVETRGYQNSENKSSLFSETDIEIKTPDKFTLRGTLTEPFNELSNTVVLMVSGSGPTDRNGNQPMKRNNSLRMLARELAKESISSLRYDKRGVGESRRSDQEEPEIYDQYPTLDTYISDINLCVEELRRMRKYSKIVILGHNEGALLSFVTVGQGTRVNGVISVAGLGRPADVIMKSQLSDSPQHIQTIANEIIEKLKTGERVEGVPIFLSIPRFPSMQSYIISIMQIDPQAAIKAVKAPLLILQGDNDMAILPEDARILHAANPASEMVLIPNMNHVMKECKSDDPIEQQNTYTNPSIPINKQLVKEIVEFINRL